jgi:hypothetical protein
LSKRANRKRKDLAAQKRAKIIAQMTELQKNFIEKNIQLCSESMDEQQSPDHQVFPTSPNAPLKFEPMISDDAPSVVQSCLGTNDTDTSQVGKQMLTCIFCQENSEVKLNSEALVLSAYVQKFVPSRKSFYSSMRSWLYVAVRECFRKIVRVESKIGMPSIQLSCRMIFTGVYMSPHVVMLFTLRVGQSKSKSMSTAAEQVQ